MISKHDDYKYLFMVKTEGTDQSSLFFLVEKHEEISLKTKQATHRKRGGWLGG
jgi:hypothetical protein